MMTGYVEGLEKIESDDRPVAAMADPFSPCFGAVQIQKKNNVLMQPVRSVFRIRVSQAAGLVKNMTIELASLSIDADRSGEGGSSPLLRHHSRRPSDPWYSRSKAAFHFMVPRRLDPLVLAASKLVPGGVLLPFGSVSRIGLEGVIKCQ